MEVLLLLLVLAGFLAFDYYAFQAIRTLTRRLDKRRLRQLIHSIYWGTTIALAVVVVVGSIRIPALRFQGDGGAGYINAIFAGVLLVYIPKLVLALFMLFEDIKRGLQHLRWTKQLAKQLAKPQAKRKLQAAGGLTPIAQPISAASGEDLRLAADKISRSEFLAKAGLITAAVPFFTIIRGITDGRYNYQVFERTIPVKGLPLAFEGLRIVHLTDIHTGSFDNKDAVVRGIRMVMQQKPDLLLFTGDIVNNLATELEAWMEIYHELQAPMGTFAVLGNHDYGDYIRDWPTPNGREKNLSQLMDYERQIGFNLLMNEHVYLEKGGQKLALVGIENWGRLPFPQYGDLDKASAGLSKDEPKILLSHDPTSFDDLVVPHEKDFHLTLSGHTHGFQFGIETGDFRWSPVQLRYERWADHYSVGHQHLYVNRGYGFIGFPGRIGILPEIAVLTLQRA
ncbi:MAG: metallophosphoesterase [Bacteroidota bacterium]